MIQLAESLAGQDGSEALRQEDDDEFDLLFSHLTGRILTDIPVHYVLYRRFIRDSLRPSLKMVYNGINIIIYHIYIHVWVIGTTKKTYQDTPVLQNPISGA